MKRKGTFFDEGTKSMFGFAYLNLFAGIKTCETVWKSL